MYTDLPALRPSERLLCGPGPTNVDPAVIEAMRKPMLGHLDPELHDILLDVAGHAAARLAHARRPRAAAAVHRHGGDGGRPGEPARARRHGDRGPLGLLRRRASPRSPSGWARRSCRGGGGLGRGGAERAPARALDDHPARAPDGGGARRDLERRGASAGRAGRGDAAARAGAADGRLRDLARRRAARDRRLGRRLRLLVHPEVPGRAARHVAAGAVRAGARAACARAARRCRSRSTCWLLERYWVERPAAYHHTAPILAIYALHEALARWRSRRGSRRAGRATPRPARTSSAGCATAAWSCWPTPPRSSLRSPRCGCRRASTARRSRAACCASTESRSAEGWDRRRRRCGGSA